jgi:hypothetical protein
MNVFVARSPDDQGLAAASRHAPDPERLCSPAWSVQVREFMDVMALARVLGSAKLTDLRQQALVWRKNSLSCPLIALAFFRGPMNPSSHRVERCRCGVEGVRGLAVSPLSGECFHGGAHRAVSTSLIKPQRSRQVPTHVEPDHWSRIFAGAVLRRDHRQVEMEEVELIGARDRLGWPPG